MDVGTPPLEGNRMKQINATTSLPRPQRTIRTPSSLRLVFAFICFILLTSLFQGCSSSFLKYEKGEKFFKNEEFEREVKIETEVPAPTSQVSVSTSQPVVVSGTAIKSTKAEPKKAKAVAAKSLKRQPDVEDSEGFIEGSRRPAVDPFRVGEKVIHAVKYFTAEAGILTLEIKPFAQVNNRKSYNFNVGLKSSRIFSNFYSVDDRVQTFLDYETLMPHVLKVNIKESGKLAQSQSYFNEDTLKASFWEKKYTEKSGEEERKFTWDILPFSQNAFSGLFYMRVFAWKVGKKVSFRVAENQKNIVFTGTAVAKETVETEAGTFPAIKIKASIVTRGALSQTGDIFVWVSDDERKYLLKIEAKIKIGTLVSEVIEIEPGS